VSWISAIVLWFLVSLQHCGRISDIHRAYRSPAIEAQVKVLRLEVQEQGGLDYSRILSKHDGPPTKDGLVKYTLWVMKLCLNERGNSVKLF
jgi:hypothetical protein